MPKMSWTLRSFPPKKITVDGTLICPKCGQGFFRIKGGTWFKFCPNCGANSVNLQTHRHEDCRYYTKNCYSGEGCLGTKEIDPCRGDNCELWAPKED